MSSHRQYTEDDKAAALAVLTANGGNISRAAKQLGIPRATLTKWRDGGGVNGAVSQKCQVKKAALGDIFEDVARLYLDQAQAKSTVTATRGKDAVVAAATAADKMQLLRGKATAVNEQRHRLLDLSKLSDEELDVFERVVSRIPVESGAG